MEEGKLAKRVTAGRWTEHQTHVASFNLNAASTRLQEGQMAIQENCSQSNQTKLLPSKQLAPG